jgi:transcription antitermination factor NusG
VADRRDGLTWVTLELTRQGERLVEEGKLEEELRRLLDIPEDWPVFIPARVFEKNGKRITVHLMEGYAFVATGLDEIHYFRAENTKLVSQVLASRGPRNMRVLSVIPDAKIFDLRRQLSEEVANDIIAGMPVIVTDGIYAKLEGIVLDIEGDHAVVRFDLRSLQVIAKIPKIFLETSPS